MKKMKFISVVSLGLTLFLKQPHLIYGNTTFGGGSGTESNPYRLSTPEHLTELQVAVDGGNTFDGKYFILTEDIDFTGYDNDSNLDNGNFDPIGNSDNAFSGYLDGCNYSISNLKIELSDQNSVALFALLENAKIENLSMININLEGNNFVGGLAGGAKQSSFYQIVINGEMSGYDSVGGILGYGNNIQLTDSESNSYIVGDGIRNGGVVGFLENNSVVKNNHFTGVVEGESYLGGLVGTVIFSQIINSEANAIVKGNSWVGGLAGALMEESVIDNSLSSGQVEGKTSVGGMIGYLDTSTINKSSSSSIVILSGEYGGGLVGMGSGSTISNSSACGKVEGSGNIGGFVGSLQYSEINNAYSVGEVTGFDYVGGFAGKLINTPILDSYSSGEVSGSSYVGGFAGLISSSLIKRSFASGSVEGINEIGGFVGELSDSEIIDSYAKGNVFGEYNIGGLGGSGFQPLKISNSYSLSNVTGKENVGGLIGLIYGFPNSDDLAILENTYHDGIIIGARLTGAVVGFLGYYYSGFDLWLEGSVLLDNIYYNQERNPNYLIVGDSTHGTITKDNVTPLTTNQMSQKNAKNHMLALDFENLWTTTSTTPMFQWQKDLTYPNQDDVQIKGTVQTMVADVTIPSVSPDLVINPNLSEGFVAPEFSILNDSVSPIKLELKTFEQTTNAFNDVLPTKYDSWEGLNKAQSRDIALGLVAKEGEGWQTLTTQNSYVAGHQSHEIGIIKPTSRVDFSFDVKYGTAFSEAKSVQYKMIFVFDLMN